MSYDEIKKQQYENIKEWFATMPKNTKISYESYLDHSYYVGGHPQINHIFTIENDTKKICYNQHSKFQNLEWLPKNINIEWLKKYILNRPSYEYLKVKNDYDRELKFYQFDNVPISEFLK